MPSEVRVMVVMRPETGEEPLELPSSIILPGEAPTIIADYLTKPPSQLIVRNIGRAAVIERSVIAPVDRLPVGREKLKELTLENPEHGWPFRNAMEQKGVVVVRYDSGLKDS